MQEEGIGPQFYIPSSNMITVGTDPHSIPHDIESLLDTYRDIFAEPKHLPPHRPGFDHKIPLKS